MTAARVLISLVPVAVLGASEAATFTIYTAEFPRLAEMNGGAASGMYVELMRKVGEANACCRVG